MVTVRRDRIVNLHMASTKNEVSMVFDISIPSDPIPGSVPLIQQAPTVGVAPSMPHMGQIPYQYP
jgi:hypothetical protein